MTLLIRFVKRLLIFLPAVAAIYLTVSDIYPTLNDRLPAALALLVAYIFAAYILVPAMIRLFRIVFPPRHVPLYTTTPDGFASDPVQLGLIGSREELTLAMQTIGWQPADNRTLKSLARLLSSFVLKKSYPTAPFSKLYLLGRHQDLGFQFPVAGNPRHRHHVRFWAVKPTIVERFAEDIAFWQTHQPDSEIDDNRFLWLGAASLDTGIGLIRHNAQITHMIHPDTNAERELIVSSLRKAKLCKGVKRIKIATPYQLRNRVITGYLETDGVLAICEL